MTTRTVIVKYVRLHEAEDWLKLGWCQSMALDGTYHGQFSMLMTWLCDCPLAVPPRRHSDALQREHQRDHDEDCAFGGYW